LEEGTKFCGSCGAKVEEEITPNAENTQVIDSINPLADLTTNIDLNKEVPAEPAVEPVSPVVNPVDNAVPMDNPVADINPADINPFAGLNTVDNVVPTENVNPVNPVEPVSPVDNGINVPVEPVPTVEPVSPVVDNTIAPAVSPVESSNAGSSEESEKKKKSFVGPVIGIILVLLIVGGAYLYYTSPRRIVKNLINKAYSEARTVELVDFKKNTVLVTGDMSIKTNIVDFNRLNGEKINFTSGIDYTNKKMEVGLALEEQGVSLIDAAMYVLNNKAYASLKGDYDKLIEIDGVDVDELFSSFDEMNTEDINYVISASRDIIINSIDMGDFTKSSANITLDGKDTKVTKLTYEVTEARMYKFLNNVIDNIIKDKKLVGILAENTGMTNDEVIADLKDSKIDVSTATSEQKVAIDIYTKGINNEFAGMDIAGFIQVRKNKDNTTIEAGMGSEKVNIVIKKVNDDTTSVTCTLSMGGETVELNATMSSKKVSDTNTTGSFSFTISSGSEYFTVEANYDEKLGVAIADIDTAGAVSAEEIPDADLDRIASNIEKRFADSNIYKFIEEYSEMLEELMYGSYGSYGSYGYDYDFDDYDSDYDFDDYDSDDFSLDF
jgi:hypothetical protein